MFEEPTVILNLFPSQPVVDPRLAPLRGDEEQWLWTLALGHRESPGSTPKPGTVPAEPSLGCGVRLKIAVLASSPRVRSVRSCCMEHANHKSPKPRTPRPQETRRSSGWRDAIHVDKPMTRV